MAFVLLLCLYIANWIKLRPFGGFCFRIACLFVCASMHFWNFVFISNKRERKRSKNWFFFFISNKMNSTCNSPVLCLWFLLYSCVDSIKCHHSIILGKVWIKISNKRKLDGSSGCVYVLMRDATLDIPNVLFHVFQICSEEQVSLILSATNQIQFFKILKRKNREKASKMLRSLNLISHTSHIMVAVIIICELRRRFIHSLSLLIQHHRHCQHMANKFVSPSTTLDIFLSFEKSLEKPRRE